MQRHCPGVGICYSPLHRQDPVIAKLLMHCMIPILVRNMHVHTIVLGQTLIPMRPAFRRSLVVAALCTGTLAGAAPTAALNDDTSSTPGAATSSDGQSVPNADGAAPSSGNRTIDRLLNGPGQESEQPGGDRPTKKLAEGSLPTKVVAVATAASAPNPLAELQAVILGNLGIKADKAPSEPNPELALTRRREVEQSSNGSRASHQDSTSGSTSPESTGVAVRVARYIRENRWLVIGVSLLVLAMVWGAATFASQRRR